MSGDPARLMPCPRREEVQRLDWRFLLRSPRLGRVCFVGPQDGTLARSLRAWGCDLSSERADGGRMTGGAPGAFDLCVVQSARASDVRIATQQLRPGGQLYWELTRRSPLASPLRHRRARADGRALQFAPIDQALHVLRDAGLVPTGAWWHRPSFETCRAIVPLLDDTGVRHLVREAWPSSPESIQTLAWALIASGLLPGVGSTVSFVAQRPHRSSETPS